MNFGFEWTRSFVGRGCFKIKVIYMHIALGQVQTIPRGQQFYTSINLQSVCSFVSFSSIPTIFQMDICNGDQL